MALKLVGSCRLSKENKYFVALIKKLKLQGLRVI